MKNILSVTHYHVYVPHAIVTIPSFFTTYGWIINKRNMTGATSGQGTAYHSKTKNNKVFHNMLFIYVNSTSYVFLENRLRDEILNVFTSWSVDCKFDPMWKTTTVVCWCLSTKHALLSIKSRECLAQSHDHISEWSDMSICKLLLQWTSTWKSNKVCCSSSRDMLSLSYHKRICSHHDIL